MMHLMMLQFTMLQIACELGDVATRDATIRGTATHGVIVRGVVERP
jgi:hypothetical protein